MDSTLIIFACAALASATALCIVLAIVAWRALQEIRKVSTTVAQVGTDVHELKSQLVPVLHDATLVLRKTTQALERVDENLQRVGKGTEAFAQIAGDVKDLGHDIIQRARIPITDAVGFASSVFGKLLSLAKTFIKF